LGGLIARKEETLEKEIDFSSAVMKPTFRDACKFCKEYGLQWWQFYNGWRLMEKDGTQHKCRPTRRAPDAGKSAAQKGNF